MATSTATAVEELPVSYHGFCLGYDGVWWFKIPDDETGTETDLKIEPVFTCDTHLFPINMGFFSSGHKVYMVGGTRYHPIFEYSYLKPDYKLQLLDSKNPQFLDKSIILPSSEMKPLLSPMVIKSDDQIYCLTQYNNPWFGKSVKSICFQSFDSVENRFRVLPSPPYSPVPLPNAKHRHYLNPGLPSFKVVSLFAACGYIYLIVREEFDQDKEFAFSFDTKASKWMEAKSMLDDFRKNQIPIPYLHCGDTGVSEQFTDNTRFLVALCGSTPTAYHVTLGSDGSLSPKSFRYLRETNSDDQYGFSKKRGTAHLLDIGSGRFCVIHQSDNILPLNVCVFKIDFKAEYELQSSRSYSAQRRYREYSSASSVIICSRKLLKDIPSTGYPSFYAYCLASAPAFQSSGKQIAGAEVQARDGNLGKKKKKRMRDGKKRTMDKPSTR